MATMEQMVHSRSVARRPKRSKLKPDAALAAARQSEWTLTTVAMKVGERPTSYIWALEMLVVDWRIRPVKKMQTRPT